MFGAGPRLEDQVVVVTGASSGIGAEVARRVAALGATVGLISRDTAALETVATGLPPGRAHLAGADVTDPIALRDALARIERRLGPPTILVNSAGHGCWGAVVDTDPETFRRAIEVNYLGVVNATAVVLEPMLRRGSGHIVNIGSIAGRIGAPFEAAYSASKFAVVGYSEALAVEIAGTGVHVSMINPGPVDTPFFRRRGHPYEGGPPRPVPPGRVADAVVAAVRSRRAEQFLPRWLGVAHAIKTLAPPAHRVGTARRFSAQRRDLRQRFR